MYFRACMRLAGPGRWVGGLPRIGACSAGTPAWLLPVQGGATHCPAKLLKLGHRLLSDYRKEWERAAAPRTWKAAHAASDRTQQPRAPRWEASSLNLPAPACHPTIDRRTRMHAVHLPGRLPHNPPFGPTAE